MQESKIHLSPTELHLFCNPEVILTKNRIIKKNIELLQEVQSWMVGENHAGDLFTVPPKISKGENYEGLPYQILDYPRKTERQNIFLIRSMFWWGHNFSITLHFSGNYKNDFLSKISRAYNLLAEKNFYTGINKDPWHHHFEEDNYKKISTLNQLAFERSLAEQEHIKIAAHWPLSEWHTAAAILFQNWKWIVQLIS